MTKRNARVEISMAIRMVGGWSLTLKDADTGTLIADLAMSPEEVGRLVSQHGQVIIPPNRAALYGVKAGRGARLKVYGWRGFRPGYGQTREIVAATSKAQARKLEGGHVSLSEISETENDREVETAMADPGVVYVCDRVTPRRSDTYKPRKVTR